jgi:serine/threonine protein kinase
MSPSRTACQPQWLSQLWEETLSDEQLAAFEQHLSVCELCQSRVDEQVSHQPVLSILADSRAELKAGVESGWTWRHTPLAGSGPHAAPGHEQPLQDDPFHSLRALAERLFPLPPQHPHRIATDDDAADDAADDDAATASATTRTTQSPELDGRSLHPPLAREPLGAIDHYDLLEPLGSGGMGFVYKAFDRRLHRLVALKVLSPNVATIGAARQRFTREAQAAATINSPHVVPIHTVAQVAGLPYLVMSLVDGPDLQSWIVQHGPLSIVGSLRVAQQIASGLQAAHRQGIVHRDVKPANILFQPSIMQASLTDFGLALVADEASLTHSGFTAGTPSFMSPEQARGEAIDARSDWYSLGCVLYTLLVGHPPFRGSHALAVLSRLQQESPKPPSHYRSEIPPWLDQLVLKLIRRDPAARLTDSDVIIEALGQCVQHLEHPSRHALPAWLQRPQQPRWPRRLALASVAVGLCLAGGWYALSTMPSDRQPPPWDASGSANGSLAQDPSRSMESSEVARADEQSSDPAGETTLRAAVVGEALLLRDTMLQSERDSMREVLDIEARMSELEAQP